MILNDILRTRDGYLITGYTDLRKSIDGLAIKALESFDLNPLEMKESAFMYCGKNTGKIKVLIFEDDGFLLLYKRLDNGRFKWPRNTEEAKLLTKDQITWLLQGLSIEQKTIGKSSVKYLY